MSIGKIISRIAIFTIGFVVMASLYYGVFLEPLRPLSRDMEILSHVHFLLLTIVLIWYVGSGIEKS